MTTTSFINFVQNLVNAGSLICIGVLAILIIAGLVRPSIFKRIMRSFTDRKYILALGVFLCMFSATIFVATDTPQQDFQQQEKTAPAKTSTYEEQSEMSPNVIEEAQQAPTGPQTGPNGTPTPNSTAVQGAQNMPGTSSATNLDLPPPANERTEDSAGQTAQAETPKSECKIRLLKVVCL